MSAQHYQLGHLAFQSTSVQGSVDVVNTWLQQCARPDKTAHAPRSIGYVNPHVFNISEDHPAVTQFLNHCDLVCVDGIGTALALRMSQKLRVNRLVALHLFDALLEGVTTPCSAVLIGVTAEDVALSAKNINALGSQLTVVASMDGFSDAERYEIFLRQHADIQWVLIGAGSPKSESIALQALQHCSQAIVFHMGAGTIKVYAGSKRRAPSWLSSAGLEWIHRILFEPHTRERYTKGMVQFLKRLNSSNKNSHGTPASLQDNSTDKQL